MCGDCEELCGKSTVEKFPAVFLFCFFPPKCVDKEHVGESLLQLIGCTHLPGNFHSVSETHTCLTV